MPKIDRIIDREMRHNRVYYLVQWKGYGKENNTWESRVDLMKDGYGSVLRVFERERKKMEDIASLSDQSSVEGSPIRRGRLSGTPRKSPARRKIPARSHSRGQTRSLRRSQDPSASRSLVAEGKQSLSLNGVTPRTLEYRNSAATRSTTPTRRSPRRRDRSRGREIFESEVTKIVSKRTTVANAESSKSFRIQKFGRKMPSNYDKEPEIEEDKILNSNHKINSSKCGNILGDEAYDASAMHGKMKRGNQRRTWRHSAMYALGVVVAAVSILVTRWLRTHNHTFVEQFGSIASLVAYQGQSWLLFVVSFFAFMYTLHRKDERKFARWIAIAMTWRTAGESLLLFDTSLQYQQVALAAFGIAAIALFVSSYMVLRDHEHSNVALMLLVMGCSGLLLSDSVLLKTNNPTFVSRIIVGSISLMVVSYSSRLIQTNGFR
uniref:Chromodomain protein putative n=1 Tax=Albugo laibachii Nc14 TaxID=890382 RepID=F0WAL6_9STRA|nr:chromodomain protein putative [Albugo laibachii Nc14]|eukprot:CCA18187.1 chromodomain protein putative [Albugo laibachii Nc14]